MNSTKLKAEFLYGHGIPGIAGAKKQPHHIYVKYGEYEEEQLISAKSELAALRKLLKFMEKEIEAGEYIEW